METHFNPLTINRVRRVGVFDSGLGGLTVLDELVRNFPQADYIYFGDNARAPYGDRPVEETNQFAEEIVDFLLTQDVDALIIACNTISAHTGKVIAEQNPDKLVIGTIDAAISLVESKLDERAQNEPNRECKLGLIATSATIKSGVYQDSLGKLIANHRLTAYPTPRLVPSIEKGIDDEKEKMEIIREEINRIHDAEVDYLVLGCTHYPLWEVEIQSYLGENVEMINPAEGMAQELGHHITWTRNIGGIEIYTSGDPDRYRRLIEKQLPALQRAQIAHVKLS